MKPALQALFEAVHARVLADAGAPWADRAYPLQAPAGVARPYLLVHWSGGGESNDRLMPDAHLVITVKCVADTLADAMAGAGRISALFNDADRATDRALDGGSDWTIHTVSQEMHVELIENVDQRQLYHEGARFRVIMEAKQGD